MLTRAGQNVTKDGQNLNMIKSEIRSLDDERYSLACLLRFPSIYADISNFIDENDYTSKLNRTVFSAIKEACIEGGEVSPYLISSKLLNLGVTFEELNSVDLVGYLEELKLIQINELAGISFFKNLKKLTVRREIWQTAGNIQKAMKDAKDADIDTILDLADKLYSERMSLFVREGGQEFQSIYEGMEERFEADALLPIEDQLDGPFSTINSLFGSLNRMGNLTLIGARTGLGKTGLSTYYNTFLAMKYNIPILHGDVGEMDFTETSKRKIVMHSNGVVPYAALEDRSWAKVPELARAVREVWKKTKNIRYDYCNLGGMSQQEILSKINRFYLSKVGRGNKSAIVFDYLKGFETAAGDRTPEWQSAGTFIDKLKALITTTCPTSVWVPLQLNRVGITTNKKASQIDDSENAMSVSDRIVQRVSHGFIFRRKTPEELVWENQKFGNCKLIPVKFRHLGKDWKRVIEPVRIGDGSLVNNFIHMNSESFVFTEKGDLHSTIDQIENNQVLSEEKNDDDSVELQ